MRCCRGVRRSMRPRRWIARRPISAVWCVRRGRPAISGATSATDGDKNLIAVVMADPNDPDLGDLLAAYRDLPFVPRPVSFSDLAESSSGFSASPPSRPARHDRWAQGGRGAGAGPRANTSWNWCRPAALSRCPSLSRSSPYSAMRRFSARLWPLHPGHRCAWPSCESAPAGHVSLAQERTPSAGRMRQDTRLKGS
jgi:hypothetical protein